MIFLCAVALLITHAQTGLTVAFIGLFIAILVLLTSGKNIGYILKNVDYKTILFFIGLFVVVGRSGADRYSGTGSRIYREGKPWKCQGNDSHYYLGIRDRKCICR